MIPAARGKLGGARPALWICQFRVHGVNGARLVHVVNASRLVHVVNRTTLTIFKEDGKQGVYNRR